MYPMKKSCNGHKRPGQTLVKHLQKTFASSSRKKVEKEKKNNYCKAPAISASASSISASAMLVGIPAVILSFAVGLKICAITAAIKKLISIINKKRKKQDKKILLAIF